MNSYPHLNSEQQQQLPKLIRPAQPIATKFNDSTHQLWHCSSQETDLVLKVCNTTNVTQSAFWQGLNLLFAAEFPKSLTQAPHIYEYMKTHGFFDVPECISAGQSYVVSRFIPGQDLDNLADIQPTDVHALAEHISKLHQYPQTQWGSLYDPKFSAEEWPKRFATALKRLAYRAQVDIPSVLLAQALEQAIQIKAAEFVPIMPDLRWDQLRRKDTGDLVLLDLDAILIGPREFDLILLEYLLTQEQLLYFREVYETELPWPQLNDVRLCYRLLLFLLNIFGETDLNAWLQHPTCT